jgi:hypothetical protein
MTGPVPIVTNDEYPDGSPAFVARYADLPTGVVGYGPTRERAIETLNAARRAYVRYLTSGGDTSHMVDS